MKNKMMAGLAVAAVSATFVVLGASAGNAADDCTPSEGTPAVMGAWALASHTEWTTDPATPADPDHQAGEDNVLNLVQIGEDDTRTMRGAETTEHSRWVTEPLVGGGWTLAEQRTVTDHESRTETVTVIDVPARTETIPGTPSQWWNWSPNKEQGPFEGQPAFPSDPRGTWQGAHTDGGPEQDQSGTFQQGNGNGSWFHREPGTPDQVVEHPAETHEEEVLHEAETHEEYSYERTTTTEATEYRWSVYERTNTPGTDPVVCNPDVPPVDPEEPPVEEPDTEERPTAQPPVEHEQPEGESPNDEQPKGEPRDGESSAHPSVPAPRSRPAAAVPTVIDAGL